MNDIAQRLAALPSLAEVPLSQLEWLAEHGTLRRFEDGTVLYAGGKGEDVRDLFVILSGRFSTRLPERGGERQIREMGPGEITGYLPYSRITSSAVSVVAVGPTEILSIAEADVRPMIRECYDVTATCVHFMIDRARFFKHDVLHQEKLAALGRLSAGLAHELNNPSSAMARSAGELDASRNELAAAARALGTLQLEGARLAAFEALEAAAAREPVEPLSAVARADREDALRDWLENHDLDAEAAYALAMTYLTTADLDVAAEVLTADDLVAAVRYVAAEANARQLTHDIVTAASRVHTLVTAVKAHTHMDQGIAPEPIALEKHLEDAIVLLGSKAAAKGVTLEVNVAPALPPVQGVVSELNHVWLHLIDNAIDAAPASGHVAVSARAERGRVVVEVVDDGPGIAPEDLGRVFDPFFTTKDVGKGAGLGLDVVQTLVQGHGGSVAVTSQSGRTAFRVVLPASPA